MAPPTNAPFRFLRQFNGAQKSPTMKILVDDYCSSDTLQDRLIRELSKRKTISVKEILESFEYFGQVRKSLQAPQIADLCCGHGLVGVLFALFERNVERVVLVDRQLSRSHKQIIEAAVCVGPWVASKMTCFEAEVNDARQFLAPGTSIASSHACGKLTDQCLNLAMELRGAVAVMPCCGHPQDVDAPEVLYRELGAKLAVDVHRTYRLTTAGYRVLWRYIPEQITPMNRIIIGKM